MLIIDKAHPRGKLNKNVRTMSRTLRRNNLFHATGVRNMKKVNIYRDTAWAYLWIIK